MPDNKTKVGNADRIRVSANEPYEVRDLADKFDLPLPVVKQAIEQEGPMRDDVESYLKKMKQA
jgi:hypothetical protein